MWDLADPKQSLLYIREYFELLHGSNGAPCSYVIHKDIVPLKHINNVAVIHRDPDALMIKRCPIIPDKEHHQYYCGNGPELLKELDDLFSLLCP